jgi:hypothetical protein
MKRVSLIVCLLAVVVTTALGQGSQSKPNVKAKIPFEFVAAGETLPAGTYTFKFSETRVQVVNHETNQAVFLPLLTRIAADKSDAGTPKISFDTRDGKHFIEALWPAGEDGYLVHTVKGEHTHEIVKTM